MENRRDTALMPGAIVLAAGASSRMGRPKALLTLGAGETFVSRIAATLAAAGLDPVIVVVRAELEPAIARAAPGARLVVNDAPERGQLSSLLRGLDALPQPAASALVTLVDLPLVRVTTVQAVVDGWRRTQAPLVRPVHRGRHGHPVVFGAALIAGLRSADLALGAKPVVHAFAAAGLDVPVDDPGVLRDIDTPSDYAAIEP
jgi:molybdenum cofactor cytidylyltransferase